MTLNESNGANKNEQQEQQNPPPPRASKRARRAPKAVYDNDFEAHEIQNVRRERAFSPLRERLFSLSNSLSRRRTRRFKARSFVSRRRKERTSLSFFFLFFFFFLSVFVRSMQNTNTGNQSVQSHHALANGRDENPTRTDFLPDRGGVRGPDRVHMLDTIESGRVWNLQNRPSGRVQTEF